MLAAQCRHCFKSADSSRLAHSVLAHLINCSARVNPPCATAAPASACAASPPPAAPACASAATPPLAAACLRLAATASSDRLSRTRASFICRSRASKCSCSPLATRAGGCAGCAGAGEAATEAEDEPGPEAAAAGRAGLGRRAAGPACRACWAPAPCSLLSSERLDCGYKAARPACVSQPAVDSDQRAPHRPWPSQRHRALAESLAHL